MSIENLRQKLPVYASDIKINFGKIFEEDAFEGLTTKQVLGIALASAYATKNRVLMNAIQDHVTTILSTEEVTAAKGAASIMAMNNVYYRFTHLSSDKEFSKMPAGLRMTFIGKPGIEKVDFELYSLAVSAINGCGMCMDAHVHEVAKTGVIKQGIQATIKISAIIHSMAQVIDIENIS